MLVAYLNPMTKEDFRFNQWTELAREEGMTFSYPLVASHDIPDFVKGLEHVRHLLETADAFFVIQNGPFITCPDLAEMLHQRVKAGSRLIVQPNVWIARGSGANTTYPDRDWWNAFLAPYDLSATTLRIAFNDQTDNVPIKRDADSFRDPAIFAGVNEVLVEDPGAIWYGGESLPVLIATDKHLAVEFSTDTVADWNGRELACMAVWHGPNREAVLFCAGSFFHDQYRGYHGRTVHGIDVNTQLARNVLKFLAEGKSRITPEDMCQRIEINLVDFVFDVVKASGDNWWVSHIPANIRPAPPLHDARFLKKKGENRETALPQAHTVMAKWSQGHVDDEARPVNVPWYVV